MAARDVSCLRGSHLNAFVHTTGTQLLGHCHGVDVFSSLAVVAQTQVAVMGSAQLDAVQAFDGH